MMATKEQERKTLERIKKMVEEIGGAESYIGMAFEGCFELAERNIDEDAGYSYKSDAESISRQLELAGGELEQVRAAVLEEHRKREAAEKALDEVKSKQLSPENIVDIESLVLRHIQSLNTEQKAAVEECINANTEVEQKEALFHLKKAADELSRYNALATILEAAR